MDVTELVKKFMDADMQLTESALTAMRARPDGELVADQVLETLGKMQNRPFMITADVVSKILERPSTSIEEVVLSFPEPKQEVKQEEKLPELVHTKFKPLAAEYEPRAQVLKEITGKSYSSGQLKDFVKLFNDRFQKIEHILRKRTELAGTASIGSLKNMLDRQAVAVIGMVVDKRVFSTGNVGIEIEDPTGKVLTFVFQNENDTRLMEKASEVVLDEVIGVIGSVRTGQGQPRMFVKDILWPELPFKREPRIADNPLNAVLLSDLHVGSDQFLEDMFKKFLNWLQVGGDTQRERDIAGRVKYVVIAGDIVDGIGVYPEQREELLIDDIYKQYEAAAKLLAQIPDYITLIIAPGNHDAVRPSEPQPAISKDIGASLYDLNSKMVGNPSLVSLDGVHFLVYHGRSFDDLIGAMPGLSRQKPTQPMIKLLQKRHLAPIYGGRVAVSPEEQDMLVIDEIPDVLHCGHVHIYDKTKYRDVWVVNSGTFQARTKYMQKLGVNPTPGHVAILNLQSQQLEEMFFGQST
jgi:DNA polymerase II small subunit